MGSKSRIAKHIVPIIQQYINDNNINTYVEPFVGVANIIDKIVCENRYGFDKNKYLIALLTRVQDNQELLESVSKDTYDMAREDAKSDSLIHFTEWEIGNIGFLASYNGRWFDGGYANSGYEKTKTGYRFRNYYLEAKRNLLKQAPNLSGIVFKSCNYEDCLTSIDDSSCLIYCDPPYEGVKEYANATTFDYTQFWDIMRQWSKSHIVLISEQNAPDDFICIWQQQVSRSIKPNDKRVAIEKLYIHKNNFKG